VTIIVLLLLFGLEERQCEE